MKLLHIILPLTVLAMTTACGDGSGGNSGGSAARSAGGTFQIEITGDDTRTLTHANASSNVSRIDPEDPPIITFQVFEPEGDGYMAYQLFIQLSDVQPGEYVFDYETDQFGYALDESDVQLSATYSIIETDAGRGMVMGGRGDQFGWGQSGTLTLHSVANDRLAGEFDVSVYNSRMPGPDRKSIRAVGEFSGVSIARR